MEYQALYRKYRPNTFGGVIGQKHITEILKNQVATGKTSHAYLFSGTRGTGKTSTAKILARAVNCLNSKDGEPCNECEACRVAADINMDIIELDAASNNGVDDMRALIEKAIFAPVKMRKKVYIIDEAHMLSGAAFNALLKTLEEPPAHVMFILATTEPHKILPTITSRCQRFDFRRLKTADIVDYLKEVLQKVGASIEQEGLETIAKKANGGMRDALSLADQCISFCGTDIYAADVYHILGSADFDAISSLAGCLITENAAGALVALDEVVAGRDLSVLVQDLTQHFRGLLLTKLCGNCADILDCTDEDMRKLQEQAKEASQERLMRGIDILTEVQGNLKFYPQPRVLVEAAFVKICRPEYESDYTATLDRLDILEKKVKEGVVREVVVPKEPIQEQKKPEKKKRMVNENAKALFEELCAALSGEIFVLSSFERAIDAVLKGKELTLVYDDPYSYNCVKENEQVVAGVVDNMGYELTVNYELDSDSKSKKTVDSIIDKLGDITVID